MSGKTLKVGAPSLTGINPNEEAKTTFQAVEYPAQFVVKNKLPRDISFPEIGVFLNHVANKKGIHQTTVKVKNFAALQRFISSVSQVAELNNAREAVEISTVQAEPKAQEETVKPTPAARRRARTAKPNRG